MSKTILKTLYILLALTLLASLNSLAFAAPPSQEEPQKDIVDIAVEDGRFTTLVTALEAADLVDTLKGEGPFTVFAPTDEAFAALPEGTLDSLLADVPALSNVLLYHVVPGKVLAADVVALDIADTVLGQPVDITVEGDSVRINEAQVVMTDIEAANGVIHVIDSVLLPPADDGAMMEEGAMAEDSSTTPDEAQMEEAAAATTCSEDYVIQADDTLSAISDKFFGSPRAFAAIVEATNAAAASDSRYTAIDDPNLIFVGQTLCVPASPDTVVVPAPIEAGAESSMVEEESAAVDVPEGKSKLVVENLSSFDLVFDLTGPTIGFAVLPPGTEQEFVVDPGQYSYDGHQPGGNFDVAPGNFELIVGQVYGLSCYDNETCQQVQVTVADDTAAAEEQEVTAAPDIVDTAVADGRFTTLVTALVATGLVDTLKGEGPFTVFAPTDEAFAKLPEGTLDDLLANTEALSDVLLYHVVPGQVMAADVVSVESVDTVLGQPLPISVDGDTVKVGEATVTATNIETGNGVIHVIDTVLVPPEAAQ